MKPQLDKQTQKSIGQMLGASRSVRLRTSRPGGPLEWLGLLGEIRAQSELLKRAETIRRKVAALYDRAKNFGNGKEPLAWISSPQPATLTASLRRFIPVLTAGKEGSPKVMAQAEEQIPLPAANASWRLEPPSPGFAGHEFALVPWNAPELIGYGIVEPGGARLTLIEYLAEAPPEKLVVLLLEN